MPRVVVAGLGPAGPELFTAATAAAIEALPRRWLRTRRHPSASAVGECGAFDDLYDAAESLEDVYTGIVEALVVDARSHGEILYLVPGSPLVAERTVVLLVADARVEVDLVPSLSFLDLTWDRLGIDPLAAGVRLVDGQRFAVEAAGERGPLLVAQCDSRNVLSDIKLGVDAPSDQADVVVLHHLGLADEVVRSVAWADLDKVVEPDHLTSLWVPHLAAPVATELVRFAELVRTLRQRCPWDREQTHRSLTRHLLEETYEVLEAVQDLATAGPDGFVHLEEELGDLLFQVVFHATLAAEEGMFTLADVARTVHDKLVGRHPHVFGSVVADTPGAVMANWEQIKKVEKGRASLMDGIAGDLPSLLYAHKVQRKAASVGLETGVAAAALARAAGGGPASPESNGMGHDEVGELLFAVVDLARGAGVDPEAALRGVSRAFRGRFEAMERLASEREVDLGALTVDEVAVLWADVDPAGGSAA
ncbi:MAG: nucleoside triphosphate pyrophosphohydrolase [Actinomycetota bacterium]|nr:nucleoside triphosphate pyrophosphohydrolase [Actinomycetota bacterium]